MSHAPRYVVIGSQGQLGREIVSLLSNHEVISVTREQADLAVPGQIEACIKLIQPQFVINCAAYNLVDQAELTPEPAFAVNARGVRELAMVCQRIGATLVHFSTDYVFGLDRHRKVPYVESDAPGPLSAYGTSKLTGEYFVRSLCDKHYVVRTCGLYGKQGAGGKGTNFIETMLKLAQSGKEIRVVSDQVLTPTSATDLARAVLQLIPSSSFGLYHLTNTGSCSWHQFAETIFRIRNLQVPLGSCSSADYGSKAARPSYSVLKSEITTTPRLRTWQEALVDYLMS